MTFRSYFLFLLICICYLTGTVKAQSPVYLTAAVEKPLKYFISKPGVVEIADGNLSKLQQRRRLMAYLKGIEADDVNYNQARVRHLYRLANLFTKLRLYPLAMKCFFKTIQLDADSISTGNLTITSVDDSALEKQVSLLGPDTNKEIKSKPISCDKIVNTFNDGKSAIAYALIFHVKQPVRGKPKIFKLANTGHTFITLIKYNADSTYASISFGFYPKKDNLLSATPIIPSTSSTFKDDSEHAWDEVVGKFISKRRFNKILALTQQYNNVAYHLSKNNCTDFGLKAAALAGMDIWDTKGSWPLGSGNNPAFTGQSIIGGKFDNSDTGDTKDLLINLNN
jgi:hypothetical protein